MTNRTAGPTVAPTDTIPLAAGSPSARRGLAAAAGAIGAAFLASLCCVGPLLFVAFGVGAGLASTFEPLRPVLTALTVALLGVGFYIVYGRRPAASAPGGVAAVGTGAGVGGGGREGVALDGAAPACCAPAAGCAVPQRRTRDVVLLWAATVLALVFLTFPQWSLLFV